MKLNTKNLFELSSSLKTTPKTKIKNTHRAELNSPYIPVNKVPKNKANTNSNLKQKFFQNSNKKINPFSESSERSHDLKFIKLTKISSTKKAKMKLETLEKNDLFEDSDANNMALTNESDNNNNNNDNNNKEKKRNSDKSNNNKNIPISQKEFEFEELYNVFKKSSLKSTIIIDNNGNNNLDFEQKKIIEDYFNKKTSKNCINNFVRPIRKIPTQIYRDNNLIFNRINHYKNVNNNNNNKYNPNTFNAKTSKNKNLNINNMKFKNNCVKIKENLLEDNNKFSSNYKKMKSTNIESFILLDDEKLIKKEKIKKDEDENNSIFENESNNSFDSSFLGSSFDDDFYKNFNKN